MNMCVCTYSFYHEFLKLRYEIKYVKFKNKIKKKNKYFSQIYFLCRVKSGFSSTHIPL